MSYGYKKIRARAKQRKWKRSHPRRWKTRYTDTWRLEQFATYSNRGPVIMIDPKVYEPWQYNLATLTDGMRTVHMDLEQMIHPQGSLKRWGYRA